LLWIRVGGTAQSREAEQGVREEEQRRA
jgi:hypothetical protein